jgi:Tol biopolymer transport system component
VVRSPVFSSSCIVISAVLCACGADQVSGPPNNPVGAVAILHQRDTLTALGESIRLTAEVRDTAGVLVTGKTVTWSVADSGVVTVTNSGLATAVGNGVTVVTATVEGVQGSITIVVRQSVAELEVEPAADTLVALSEQLQLQAHVRDARGNDVEDALVQWMTADTNVIVLTDSGLVTAIANGEAIVEVEAEGFHDDAHLVVAQEIAAVGIEPESDSLLALGEEIQLVATALDSAGSEVDSADVIWSTTDTSVIELSALGLVTAKANGVAAVEALTSGVSGHAEIVVWQEVTEMTLTSPVDTLVALAETMALTLTAWDSGGSLVAQPEVVWSSSNGGVLTVSDVGVVTSVGNGTAVVTAASGVAQVEKTIVVEQVAAAIVTTPPADTIVQTGWVDLQATFFDANWYVMADPMPLSWTSSDDGTASVTPDGRVSGHVPGVVTIRASWHVLAGESEITVAIPDVQLAPELPSLFASDTMWLDGAVLAPNGDRVNSGPLTWESANMGIATVSDAVVSGVTSGLVMISAGLVGVWDTVEVAVLDPSAGVDREIGYVRSITPPGELSTQELRAVSLDGASNTRVSVEGEYVSDFAWSTSGGQLAISYAAVNGVGRSGTYITLADGSGELDMGEYLWSVHWSPTDDRIAFRNYISSGESDVYTMGPDGSSRVQLTSGVGDELEPRWSPDGRRILYRDPVIGSDESELWVMKADGSNPSEISLPTSALRARWSPDGKFIAFDNGWGIWLVDAFGNCRPMTTNCDAAGNCSDGPRYIRPAWSPDAKRLAFYDDADDWVYVIDVDGSNAEPLSEGEMPEWSPSGELIAFASRPPSGWPSITIIRPDGSGKVFLTSGENAYVPRWR